MRHSLLVLFMLFSTLASSQIELGVKAGLSSSDLDPESILIHNGLNTTEISIAEAGYGFHFGLYTRLRIANIFIEPSFLLNSSRVDYNVEEQIVETGVFSTIKSETYNNLDIPLMIGMKIGFLRIQGGPVAHILLNSTSELTDINGYRQRFRDASYGIQGGIGLDIWRIRLDLNYETNLSNYGSDVDIDGETFQFDQRPGRMVASIGLRF